LVDLKNARGRKPEKEKKNVGTMGKKKGPLGGQVSLRRSRALYTYRRKKKGKTKNTCQTPATL